MMPSNIVAGLITFCIGTIFLIANMSDASTASRLMTACMMFLFVFFPLIAWASWNKSNKSCIAVAVNQQIALSNALGGLRSVALGATVCSVIFFMYFCMAVVSQLIIEPYLPRASLYFILPLFFATPFLFHRLALEMGNAVQRRLHR
jgi:hypothetical protein